MGDSLTADVAGAEALGLDTAWINRSVDNFLRAAHRPTQPPPSQNCWSGLLHE